MFKIQKVKIRSPEENKYYHGCVVQSIAQFKKWTTEKAHEWVKDTFGIESTATLNTIEFETLMANIRNHCKYYWNLIIPEPNE